VRFSILVNDTPTDFFSSSCGLRQGDPLFPLLFVIVMEAFRKVISTTMNGGFLSGFSLGSRNVGELNIAHILFADDTNFFVGQTQITFVIYVAYYCVLKLS